MDLCVGWEAHSEISQFSGQPQFLLATRSSREAHTALLRLSHFQDLSLHFWLVCHLVLSSTRSATSDDQSCKCSLCFLSFLSSLLLLLLLPGAWVFNSHSKSSGSPTTRQWGCWFSCPVCPSKTTLLTKLEGGDRNNLIVLAQNFSHFSQINASICCLSVVHFQSREMVGFGNFIPLNTC